MRRKNSIEGTVLWNNWIRKVCNRDTRSKSYTPLAYETLLHSEDDVDQTSEERERETERESERCVYGMQQPNLFYK